MIFGIPVTGVPDASASAHAQYGIAHAQKHVKPITDGQDKVKQTKK